MSCNCIDVIQEKLAPYNLELPLALVFLKNKGVVCVSILTIKKDKTKKTKTKELFPAFCCFCGKSIAQTPLGDEL